LYENLNECSSVTC